MRGRTARVGGRVAWGRLGSAALSAVLVVGCSQSTSPEFDALNGRWSWVDSVGGIAGMTITPASAGYTMTVEFIGVGSSQARLRVLRDGALFGETTVERTGAAGGQSGELNYANAVLGFAQQEFTITNGNTLVLEDGCCDGFSYRFQREGS